LRSRCDAEIEARIAKIEEAEAKRAKDALVSELLRKKVGGQRHPLQQLQIHYLNQTKGKSYSEEEDRFLLVTLSKIGMGSEDVWEKVKREVLEWPGFRCVFPCLGPSFRSDFLLLSRFNWWIKSRTPQEIGRRCKTLAELVEKEFEVRICTVNAARSVCIDVAGMKQSEEEKKGKPKKAAATNGDASTKTVGSKVRDNFVPRAVWHLRIHALTWRTEAKVYGERRLACGVEGEHACIWHEETQDMI
jgi:SWI/SNF-related matrix-associated actin-dependent regulator of chromatin subfamily A member 5